MLREDRWVATILSLALDYGNYVLIIGGGGFLDDRNFVKVVNYINTSARI